MNSRVTKISVPLIIIKSFKCPLMQNTVMLYILIDGAVRITYVRCIIVTTRQV